MRLGIITFRFRITVDAASRNCSHTDNQTGDDSNNRWKISPPNLRKQTKQTRSRAEMTHNYSLIKVHGTKMAATATEQMDKARCCDSKQVQPLIHTPFVQLKGRSRLVSRGTNKTPDARLMADRRAWSHTTHKQNASESRASESLRRRRKFKRPVGSFSKCRLLREGFRFKPNCRL